LGNIGFTMLQYRLGEGNLIMVFLEYIKWVPFFFFFGGLSIPLTQAILAHLFSYNMTWGATKKEVDRSNFFQEIPKMFKRFWFLWTVSFIIVTGMIILSTTLVPLAWSGKLINTAVTPSLLGLPPNDYEGLDLFL